VLRLWLQHGLLKDDPRLRMYAHTILSVGIRPEPALHLEAKAQPAKPMLVESEAQPAKPMLVEPLSQREREVLLLVAKGLSNQQIADRLVISIRTVKKHVENIHGKLGVLNRTQAVARARELRLIE
jgi:ATP/maltotriose-dependent transcriptional regulator MalT